jgi:mannan endo-1,4-beta-mannosidase
LIKWPTSSTEEYLERYPGDDIVDLLGFDLYDRGPDYLPTMKTCTEMLTNLATEKGKIAAVTEAGGPIAENHEWWTEVLETLRPFNLSYFLVWRNPHKPSGHGAFAPYKGSPDSENFIEFYNDPKTLFQKTITRMDIYQ